MRKLLGTACLMGGLLLTAGTADAQGIIPIAVEGRGGYAMPQGDWNESEMLENGYGYGIGLRVQVMPLLSIYGGWDKYSFEVEGDGDFDASDSGLHLGGQISLPLSAVTGISPFAFGGLVYNRTSMSFQNDGVSVEVESDEGLGYEVGAGLAIPFAPTLTLTPQVRYRSHEAEFPVGGEMNETTVDYLSFDVGLKLGL